MAGCGRLRWNVARRSASAVTASTFWYQALRGLARNFSGDLPSSMSQVHLTSLAVKGWPSCHLTPCRSRKRGNGIRRGFQTGFGRRLGALLGQPRVLVGAAAAAAAPYYPPYGYPPSYYPYPSPYLCIEILTIQQETVARICPWRNNSAARCAWWV